MTTPPPAAGGQPDADAIVLERFIDAPIDVVWQAWTDAEHFRSWYGPAGATVPVADLDVRVGGTRRVAIEMQTPNGAMTMWFVGEHVEVDEPNVLVYTEAMADETGTPLPPEATGMPPGHSAVTEVRVELRADGARMDLRLTHVGVPADSPGATGWAMALDKLAELAAGATR